MAEPRDDDLARRYRALGREEPPAALDEAILAAAREAAPRRARAQWWGPVSVAAVLVLGLGLVLRMQSEQPGVETSAPASEYAMPAPAEPPAAVQQAPAPAQQAPAAAPPPPALQRPPAPMMKREASPSEAPAPQAKRMQPSAADDAALPKRMEPPAMAAAARETPEQQLERIARLRGEGRHEEADKVLEQFRRAHPDYRIPEDTWSRVRPRQERP